MDLERIQELLKLMETNGLEEVEIEDKDFKVRLKKEPKGVPHTIVAAPGGAAAHGASVAGEGTPAGPDEVDPAKYHTISSPIVGSFYRASTPDGEPFVEVGDPVESDMVVCIVEAMKVMNEVKAEIPGTVEKILIENGRPVEYGQPLFLIARS